MDRTGEVEALRRRLYRPDASADDRRRYAAAVGPEPTPTVAPETRPKRMCLPSVLLSAAATVALVVAGLAIAHAASSGAARPAAAATSITVSTPPPTPLLKVGTAGAHAETIHGTGSTTVALDVTNTPFAGGTFAVFVSGADERPVGWRAYGLQTRSDWSNYRKVLRTSPARDRQGATRADELDYRDDPPRWIAVQAAADASWTLSVIVAR